MSSIVAFLSQLNDQDIKVRIDGDQLRINAPQGALTPELTTQLRSRKAEILAFLQQNRVEPTASAIQPVDRTASIPLSFSQQRLWFLEQLGSGATYTIPAVFQLDGPLNVPALQKALTEVVRRHESLRTTFEQLGRQTRQVFHAPTPVVLSIVDLQHLPLQEQQLTVQRLAREETLRPFDLASDLMIRATLLRLDVGSRNHVLLLTLHHIAADGWSIGVLLRELTALYAAFVEGLSSPLPELAIQYADFAVWQRNRLQGAFLEEQLAYWKTSLSGAPELLQLPTDFARPPVQTLRGAKLDVQLSAELTRQLRQLSQRAGTTLFMTLLAAFQVLLARYSGQKDIVVDTPIANRNHHAIEPLIGYFVNDLALRADLSGNPTFLELLEQVRRTAQGAYQHQDLPFERVVEVLQPQRNLGYNPVAQVFFALQNATKGDFELCGIDIHALDLEVQQTRMDLEVHLVERGDGLDGSWLYSADLFAPATIQRMIDHFKVLLGAIAANPTQNVLELALLTETERRQLLIDWNATELDFPNDKCLHQLFEAQVERTPDAIAVIFDEERLTYRELNAQANQLAHRLQSLGVVPETLVCICVERSLEMMVGILGIMKAGGAYVPLDPAYPAERITFILEETGSSILLTQARLQTSLSVEGAQVITLDADKAGTAAYPTTNPESAIAPHHLAYVMYTSGSTGRPKGVLIEHESVVAHCSQYQRFYAVTPADRSLQLASFHFDASVEQTFPALITGASVVLPEWDLAPVHFSQQLLRFGVTILDLAGPYLRLLLQTWIKNPELIANSPLRIVIAGADVMPVDLITLWRQTDLHRHARLFNVYGPTETTVAATVFEITSKFDVNESRIPIGPPLANRKVYVLDPQRQPTPMGVPGELHIGGIGPARGYFQRPELTREKFIDLRDLPLVQDEIEASTLKTNGREHTRLYRTGDLVRWLSDGTIDFLGRIDQQVKIRSFRVELGEIEAVLTQHPLVQETAVLVRDDETGQKRLIAYLTPELSDSDISELREHLKKKLPEYMVPDAFIALVQFPKTPIGLLDRHALPAPGILRSASPHAPPGNAAEEKIAAVWESVLKRQGLSIHDNFFDVGGHSLSAMEVHNLLHDDYPSLRMVDLFSYPTIHGLADHLNQSTDGTTRNQASQDRGAKRRAAQATRQQRRPGS